jgi:Domain of unknown function (DUF4365)
MPKRDRKHEIETESQRAFESALPPSVVVRPISDDYGIDREVEVFVNGQTTGLIFKVQLKGTDGSGAKLRIKRSSLEYWRSLDVPVLLFFRIDNPSAARALGSHHRRRRPTLGCRNHHGAHGSDGRSPQLHPRDARQ